MTKRQNILIHNIYYMLSYAFQVLRESNYESVASEAFEHIYDLFAAILEKGITKQLKQGLHKEYVTYNEDLSVLRGKIDLTKTIQHKIQRKQLLNCDYDVLSVNNLYNQIIKSTVLILLKQSSVQKEHRSQLKKAMLFFAEVDDIDPLAITWSTLKFHKSNQSYKMLLNLCYFVIEGLLLTNENGDYKLASFLDEQRMSSLYEKFILEYYRYHYPSYKVKSGQINWQIDDGVINYLPMMQSDIMISKGDRTLIIDAKYYSKSMQQVKENYKHTLHSQNLYQIYTYVKNYDNKHTGKVSGMLLYAKTDEMITPDATFQMDGNTISAKTLDLNLPFDQISNQLNKLIEAQF